MKTTIQIDVELKKLLDELKIHDRESYSSVIRRLLESRVDDEPLSEDTLRKIEEALEDIKSQRLYSSDEVRRRIE
jgi:predicted CopG family antitoxin